MSRVYRIFAEAFEYFSRRRLLLYVIIAAVVVSGSLILRNIRLTEDVQPLIPSGSSEAARDFRLLQQAPFMQKVVINLRADPGVDERVLFEAADEIAAALKPPLYRRALSGPEASSPDRTLAWVLEATPSLFTEQDREKVDALLTPQGVAARLEEVRRLLVSPEGLVMKPLLQSDPFQMYLAVLHKLGSANMLKGMVLRENHFLSADGRNTLVIGETPVKITDSVGSRDLVTYTGKVIDAHRRPGITVSFLSGHSYTTANAETIKEDLFVILTSASCTILALLFLFMRSWRAIFVFLVPTSVACIATAGVLCIYQAISAVTIAFGSVLMGIADDYPIFTYFSLRGRGDFRGEEVARISRPVLMTGLTTMATFSALFFSDLPGQRQIAFFTIIGITASLAFSLFALPHFIRGVSTKRHVVSPSPVLMAPPRFSPVVVGVWAAVMALSLWQMTHVRFNGDMRAISMIPKGLRAMEAQLKETWGDFRGMAMVFVHGRDLESALADNDRLFSYLQDKMAVNNIVNLAPLLPSKVTQEENRRRWEREWSKENREKAARLLEREGEKEGFTAHAFDPFLKRLSHAPAPVTIEGLRNAGFGDLIDALLLPEGSGFRLLTLVPDLPETAALFGDRTKTPFVERFVSSTGFNKSISAAMIRNFVTYIIIASAVILAFLFMVFRSLRKVIYAAVPVVSGLLFMFGAMGAMGIEFNLFNIIATILVIGLSVDLGIFMVSRFSEGNDRATSLAVLLGGLTSLVGMGALALARHPALFSMGITVLLGMCGAIPSALFVIPALYRGKPSAA